jgi:hypothetical protein
MGADSRELLRGIGGRLHIELTEQTVLITEGLANRKSPPTATIRSLTLKADVFENEHFRPLTETEMSAVALTEPEVVLRGLGAPVHHVAPNGQWFTVRDLLAAVEETERVTRQESQWFGGVDIHHVFFQGLQLGDDNIWQISWGS